MTDDSEWVTYEPPPETNVMVGCGCLDASTYIRIVQRPRVQTKTLQCMTCGDARVIRSPLPA